MIDDPPRPDMDCLDDLTDPLGIWSKDLTPYIREQVGKGIEYIEHLEANIKQRKTAMIETMRMWGICEEERDEALDQIDDLQARIAELEGEQ